MKYNTIYADPPWKERGSGKIKRGADKHYNLMTTQEICKMADFVKNLSNDNCHLYLWVTNNFLPDGLKVMKEWGFEYKTMITWNKVLWNSSGRIIKGKIGLGQYFRGITEHCLFGVKGNIEYKKDEKGKRMQGKTGFYSPLMKHSQKPEIMRQFIETVSYPPFIELFARNPVKRNNWDYWGNEI